MLNDNDLYNLRKLIDKYGDTKHKRALARITLALFSVPFDPDNQTKPESTLPSEVTDIINKTLRKNS